MHVLFCESNKKYQEYVSGLLKKEGHEVFAVRGGQDALDKLDEVPHGTFHAVVINDDVLQVDGVDVLRFIREWKGLETLPVVIFSVNERGMKEYVEKLGGVFFSKSEITQLLAALVSIEKGIGTA